MTSTGLPKVPSGAAPGWFPDPWGKAPWRWWDGQAWTSMTDGTNESVSRLPDWLSPPVCFASLPALVLLALSVIGSPVSLFLSLAPILIVGPVLLWLDRIEPEPWAARLHAGLWGATVAVVGAWSVNTLVVVSFGETAAQVVSAPIVEEGLKAAGVLWAVRRKDLDGVMDGAVYAGWVALGFAAFEDVLYFSFADSADVLGEVFLLRALLTPFAHPLFTLWTGLAVGYAISRGKSLVLLTLGGYAVAVSLHALWNGSLGFSATAGDSRGSIVLLATGGLFVVLFIGAAIALTMVRNREKARFIKQVPMLAARYGLTPGELAVFGDWRTMLKIRGSLSRTQRKHFDGVHTALARLSELHSHPDGHSTLDERRMAAELESARRAPSN